MNKRSYYLGKAFATWPVHVTLQGDTVDVKDERGEDLARIFVSTNRIVLSAPALQILKKTATPSSLVDAFCGALGLPDEVRGKALQLLRSRDFRAMKGWANQERAAASILAACQQTGTPLPLARVRQQCGVDLQEKAAVILRLFAVRKKGDKGRSLQKMGVMKTDKDTRRIGPRGRLYFAGRPYNAPYLKNTTVRVARKGDMVHVLGQDGTLLGEIDLRAEKANVQRLGPPPPSCSVERPHKVGPRGIVQFNNKNYRLGRDWAGKQVILREEEGRNVIRDLDNNIVPYRAHLASNSPGPVTPGEADEIALAARDLGLPADSSTLEKITELYDKARAGAANKVKTRVPALLATVSAFRHARMQGIGVPPKNITAHLVTRGYTYRDFQDVLLATAPLYARAGGAPPVASAVHVLGQALQLPPGVQADVDHLLAADVSAFSSPKVNVVAAAIIATAVLVARESTELNVNRVAAKVGVAATAVYRAIKGACQRKGVDVTGVQQPGGWRRLANDAFFKGCPVAPRSPSSREVRERGRITFAGKAYHVDRALVGTMVTVWFEGDAIRARGPTGEPVAIQLQPFPRPAKYPVSRAVHDRGQINFEGKTYYVDASLAGSTLLLSRTEGAITVTTGGGASVAFSDVPPPQVSPAALDDTRAVYKNGAFNWRGGRYYLDEDWGGTRVRVTVEGAALFVTGPDGRRAQAFPRRHAGGTPKMPSISQGQ